MAGTDRPMRSDARRNRELLVSVARGTCGSTA